MHVCMHDCTNHYLSSPSDVNIPEVEATMTTPMCTSYDNWIPQWKLHISTAKHVAIVPPTAMAITTPLQTNNWISLLRYYPNQELTSFFISGLLHGFRVGYSSQKSLKSAKRNLPCALEHPEVVDQYLAEELAQHRIVDSYHTVWASQLHISRFGVIPKNHQPNKWRLITDLSHPANHSVNDGIPKTLCSLSYITIDSAIKHIIQLGQGTLLAKIDIKHAFRLLPVHPADRHLLAMRWRHQIFINTCLPFGLHSVPKLFNVLADLLSWILEQQGVTPLLHYLDDFLLIAPPQSSSCQHNLCVVKQVCSQLGIPLALEKVEGPTNLLTFLGITLDTKQMEARLPNEKLSCIRTTVRSWLRKKKATKREILSLVGLLQHATKVVKPGRTFVARMYATAAKVKRLSFYTRLTKSFRSDLQWWHMFITRWNGISFLHNAPSTSHCDYQITTDASGSWGCGAHFNGRWFQLSWSANWASISIMAKELVPIVLSCAIWSKTLSQYKTEFRCDNLSVVEATKKESSKDPMAMHLLRCLWFLTAMFDINIEVSHIPGVLNTSADFLSRNQLARFLRLHPQASTRPESIPPALVALISPKRPDWTSSTFRHNLRKLLSLTN